MSEQVVDQNQSVSQESQEPDSQPQQVAEVAPAAAPEPEKSIQEKIGEVAKAAKSKAAMKEAPAVVIPPQFTPNYKFRALDKDHEIPESLRVAIKDAESEKQVRELMLKSMGMDYIKPKYAEVRKQYDELNTNYNTLTGSIQELRNLYQKGDMDTFFERLNIPADKILQYAVQKVQYKELPHEQQQIIEARREAEQRATQLEQQNYQLTEQNMVQAVEAKKWSLQMVMQRPDIQSFADAYDRAIGQSGSFREAVIRTGESAYHERQKDISPEEAVNDTIRLLGPMYRGQAAQPQANQPAVQAPPVQNKPPVIPNVQGRASASPMKKQPVSVDDLRKLYKDKYNRA